MEITTWGIEGMQKGLEKHVIFRDLMPEIPSTTYATFGLYKYPAKFIPQVIAYALKTFSKPGGSVFDPFAGYSTVGTVARLYGNNYELWDLNPLLCHLHSVAVMSPVEIDADRLICEMRAYEQLYYPDWSNIAYWYPEPFLPMLQKVWGFYHSLGDCDLKSVLLLPLLKTTRYFSYNDEKRQKLSRSPMARRRTDKLQCQDWQDIFFSKIRIGIDRVLRGLEEYASLNPEQVESTIRAGINAFTADLSCNHNILLTSPPYLQAQEYIRSSKMDLFWLGYPESRIRELGKMEFPYYHVPEVPIYSDTYQNFLENITEPKMAKVFQRYFHGVLGTLSRLQQHITDYLLLFVGPATIRTKPVPIDRIFMEHFQELGWEYEATLIDTIVTRAMFFYEQNPATRSNDNRMTTEHLVVLSRG